VRRTGRIFGRYLLIWATAALTGCSGTRGPVLHVATWNIAHGRGLAKSQGKLPRLDYERNLADIGDSLRTWQADLVALEEADGPSLWSGSFDHVQALADAASLPHHYRGTHIDIGVGRWRIDSGTALLADRPLADVRSARFATELVRSKGFIWAQVDFAGRPVTVASVHLHPNSPPTRARQARQVVAQLSDAPRPLIVLGDLNCTREEEAFAVLTGGLDLRAWRRDADDLATFPSTGPRLRIDWILISPELTFADYAVHCPPYSDHCAVVADIVNR